MNVSLTRQQVRAVDERTVAEYGLPSIVLMENAGRGVADKLFQFGLTGPVVVCCGGGNNGGDGFVLARHLDLRCATVRVVTWGEPLRYSADTATNFRVLEKSGVPIEAFGLVHDAARLALVLDGAATIVDALLGTGARGEPRAPLDSVIDQLNAHPAWKLAVDLPSGLDADTGTPAAHTIRARHTCTFVARKRGFDVPGSTAYTGAVHVLDIGAPRKLVDDVIGGR